MEILDYLHYVDFTGVPKKHSTDDITEEINQQQKANIENIVLDVADWILELPDAWFDASQDFSIRSKVGHDDQKQVRKAWRLTN